MPKPIEVNPEEEEEEVDDDEDDAVDEEGIELQKVALFPIAHFRSPHRHRLCVFIRVVQSLTWAPSCRCHVPC